MAEQRATKSRNSSSNRSSSRSNANGNGSGNTRNRGLSAREAVEAVREDFPMLLGRPIESVLGVERGEEGGWLVRVQVVELERIPRSTDVLGAYAVELDKDGELVGYGRQRRYNRGQPDQD